jgi:cobalamin biosynthesis Mg chelatase CobN
MLNMKLKRPFVCITIVALLLSVATASVAYAREEDTSVPPADENNQASEDIPNLIMTLDGNVTAPDDQSEEPNLYQAQDTPTEVDDNSTRVIAQDDTADGAEQNSLIATNTSPDYTVPIVGLAGLLAAVAAIGALLIIRKRKTD